MPEYETRTRAINGQTWTVWVCKVCGACVEYCGTHNAWHKALGK